MSFIKSLQNSNSIKKSSRVKPLLLFLFLISFHFHFASAQTNQVGFRFTDAVGFHATQNFPENYHIKETDYDYHFTAAISFKHYTPTFFFTQFSFINNYENYNADLLYNPDPANTIEDAIINHYQNKIGASIGFGKRLFLLHFLSLESSLQTTIFPYYEISDKYISKYIHPSQNTTHVLSDLEKYYNNEFSFSIILNPSIYITKKIAVGIYLDNQFNLIHSKKNITSNETLFDTNTKKVFYTKEYPSTTDFSSSFQNNWLIPYLTLSYNLNSY